MFWLAFISIVLFIIFLIVILISTIRTSTNKTLRGLKDELDAKNKVVEPKATKAKEVEKPSPIVLENELSEKQESVAVQETTSVEESVDAVEELVSEPETVLIKEDEPIEEVEEDAVLEESIVEPSILQEDNEPFIEEEPVEVEEETVELEEPSVAVESVIEEDLFIEEDVEENIEPTLDETFNEEVPEAIVAESSGEVILEKEEAVAVEPEPVIVEEEPIVEEVEDTYNYQVFDNTRTMEEFGLSKEEANDFIVDLIQQIEEEMPGLEEAVSANDVRKIEDISHMVKGSATNLGTGGIADVLVDFNTYMKTGSESSVVAGHMRNLRRALVELKEQFQ